jgi:hypothetical protein
MAGLRKILLFTLVICTLGYGSAWAYDGHAVDIDKDVKVTVVSISSGDQSSEQSSSADVICDHCGHVTAHLQAIFPQNGYLCSVNQSSELLELSEDLTSLSVSPDLRPPRV